MENKTMKKNIKQGIKKALKKEELEKAEWEYFEDETEYSPRVEATTTINGYYERYSKAIIQF